MRGRLGHVAAARGRADAAALAGEGHDERLAAARAASTGESEAEDAALEIAAEFVLDVSRHGPLRLVTPLEPALKMLRHFSCGAVSCRGVDARSGVRDGEPTGCRWIARRQVWWLVMACTT